MQPSRRKRTTTTLYLIFLLFFLRYTVKLFLFLLFFSSFLFISSLIGTKKANPTIMYNIIPSSSKYVVPWYPALLKIGVKGLLLENVKKISRISVVSTKSRLTYYMIVVRTISTCIGLMTENKTVKTIIWSALTIPHKNWSTPESKKLAAKFEETKTVIDFSIASWSDCMTSFVPSWPIYCGSFLFTGSSLHFSGLFSPTTANSFFFN